MQNKFLNAVRPDFGNESLSLEDALTNPFEQFSKWMDEAIEKDPTEPNAMTLATVGKDRPSLRTVLLRSYDERGFVFYTNYLSRKGKELKHNPRAAVLFYWPLLKRQVRIQGKVDKCTKEESVAYFDSRPETSRAASIASKQSQTVNSKELQKTYEEVLESGKLNKPANWGGYRLAAESFEFWQGKSNRMHDRVVYRKDGKSWKLSTIAP